MKASIKRRVLSLFIGILLCGVVAGIIIYLNPVFYTGLMLRLERYTSVVKYYNQSHLNETDKEAVDGIILKRIDDAYETSMDYSISFNDAERILSPFLKTKDSVISDRVRSHLSHIGIEKAGNEALVKAKECFENDEYLQAAKCLDGVDRSYSSYRSLKDIYDESVKTLLKEISTPVSEDDYIKTIKILDDYIIQVKDDAFVKERDRLEKELIDYRIAHEIIEKATMAFENKNYKECFTVLSVGCDNYPNSNKIKYAASAYQYAYILTVTGQTEMLLEEKKYDVAIQLVEGAIDNYECKEFKDLLDSVKRKDSILYNIGANLSDAGKYVFYSAKKLVMGDFAEDEKDTLLSLGGSIAASVVGVDTPLDVRDLAYDISHWGEGKYFAARFALDVVGVIPLIGAVKYIKHVDTAVDVMKKTKKSVDALDEVHGVVKKVNSLMDFADEVDTVHDFHKVINNVDDIADLSDVVHDTTNVLDNVHDVSNAADTVHDLVNTAENANDISKQIDLIVDDIIQDVTKNADIVPDLTDDFSDIVKSVDKAEDAVDIAHDISKKGGSYSEVFKKGEGNIFQVNHIPADAATDIPFKEGPAIKMSVEDHKKTASFGSSLEAFRYRKKQKELIKSGHFLDAVQMDIDDIRSKFGNKYDDAIDEMMEYINRLIKEGKISA